MSLLGHRIIQLRERKGWTQGQLAIYARVNQAHLSRIETGSRENIGIDYLKPIARALGTSIDYLVGLADDPRPLAVIQSSENQSLVQQVGSLLAEPAMEECFELLVELTPEDREDIHDYVRYVTMRRQESSF